MSKKNGLNTELLENGMTLQTNYLNGLKSGTETYYYSNGQKASEGFYKDNKLEGTLIYWYDNGQRHLKVITSMTNLKESKRPGMKMDKLNQSRNTKMENSMENLFSMKTASKPQSLN